jgi:ribokinase
MSDGPRIAVLGSVHMDLIARAQRLPVAGETINGDDFALGPGGKGAAQAWQCARLGAATFIITQMGDDLFGHALSHALAEHGVDTSAVKYDTASATGVNSMLASPTDSLSILHAGAAAKLSPAAAADAVRQLLPLDALIIHLDLPLGIAVSAAEAARDAGVRVILNASPAPREPLQVVQRLMPHVSAVVLNRQEAGQFLGRVPARGDLAHAARTLGGMGPEHVLITAGAEGAVAWDGREAHEQSAFAVPAIDKTGAGDAFLGAYTVLTAQSLELPDVLLCACAAGAMAASKPGLLDALPNLADVEAFLERQ